MEQRAGIEPALAAVQGRRVPNSPPLPKQHGATTRKVQPETVTVVNHANTPPLNEGVATLRLRGCSSVEEPHRSTVKMQVRSLPPAPVFKQSQGDRRRSNGFGRVAQAAGERRQGW